MNIYIRIDLVDINIFNLFCSFFSIEFYKHAYISNKNTLKNFIYRTWTSDLLFEEDIWPHIL